MPPLIERVREALAPRYEVEGEVASGGMATVFRALDTSLRRAVAIKVLRPDMATATGEARFLREARTLASFSHPNVVSIHDVDQQGGLSYYVMDLMEGETLEERLSRGPLDGRDSFRLGRGLLRALGRMHAAGIVHRDVKPSNVFLVDGRILLADFGIVRIEESADDSLTTEGGGPGTPAYMSPEQAKGDPVSAPSDLYSVGLVLYEAMSGRRWPVALPPEAGDWRGIPIPARPALKKALAVDPDERWSTAEDFLGSLRTRGRAIRLPRRDAALLGAAVALLGWWALGRPGIPRAPTDPVRLLRDVAVFPCETAQAADSALGVSIGRYVAANLEVIPGITRVPYATSVSVYNSRTGIIEPTDWTETLNARHAATCHMSRGADGVIVNLALLGEAGEEIYAERMPIEGVDEAELLPRAASRISAHLVFRLTDHTLTDEEIDRFARVPFDALSQFMSGQDALRRGAWRSAEAHYEEAIEADESFALAHLRLVEVRRWMADRPIGAALSDILAMDLSSLGPLDSLLLRASATPHGPEQLAAFRTILDQPEYQLDAYATLLYADELYHRGALWGVGLDSAIAMLERAVSRDSFLVPAVEHLTQALIRIGREGAAADALSHLSRIHAAPGESDLYYPAIWEWGFNEKFHPDQARENRASMAGVRLEDLSLYARSVRYIDSPPTQAELGGLLVSAADHVGSSLYAAQGFVDRGLGLVAQGLVEEGVASFDSAARRMQTPATLTQAAEWAVIPYALGADGFLPEEAARGRDALEDIWETAQDPGVRVRAATALALLADREGNGDVRDEWTNRIESLIPAAGAGAARHHRLALAIAAASRGDYEEALRGTAADLAYDSAGLADRPFLRSALYLKRGEWYREMGMPDSADMSWGWHENTDLESSVPLEQVQAGEVDAALGARTRDRVTRLRLRRPE